jgi:citrate lyase subunit beta/citryl-CoA lyase
MESAAMAREVAGLLGDAERAAGLPDGHLKIIAWIETAKGVSSAREVAEATPRMLGLAFGAEDFTADMGITRTKTGEEVAVAKAMTAIAARAADILAFDTPDPDFRDIPGLMAEANRAKSIGFKGKFCIHPAQIVPVNEVFQPSKLEVEHARRVVAAFDEARAKGSAAIALDGKMVDTPVWKRAVKVLEVAEAMERASKAG